MDYAFLKNIAGLTSDSRDVRNGYLFAALKGVHHDGHDFIDIAIENGATYILVDEGHNRTYPSYIIVIKSSNPRRDFAQYCAEFYNTQPDNIVAVTGTNGKTSVADFMRQLFDLCGEKGASLGTLGLVSNYYSADNVMTTPDPVLLHKVLKGLHDVDVNYMAMEASSHGLDQHRLDGVKPKVAAFTNLTQDHLDYHGDMDTYFHAKKRLFTTILQGHAIVNIDDEYGVQLAKELDLVMTYGVSDDADFSIQNHMPHAVGQSFSVQYNGELHAVDLSLIGAFQSHNVVCALACCVALGFDLQKLLSLLPELKGVRGRMECAHNVRDKNIAAYIDYAHTPDALEKALQSLRPHVKGRLICAFGAGGDRDNSKRPLMGYAATQYADHVIVTDDNPRNENAKNIRDEVIKECLNADNIGDRGAAIQHGVDMLQDGDVLLVAGKGHEQGQVVGDKTLPFDDLSVTKAIMKKRFKI